MLNRKSNEAPARAGAGAAHNTSVTKTAAILPARRRIMASPLHDMTSVSTGANVMPGGPLFKFGGANHEASTRFSDASDSPEPDRTGRSGVAVMSPGHAGARDLRSRRAGPRLPPQDP